METDEGHERIWQASIDKSGRVLLPVELRRMMAAQPGASLLWVKDERGIHLKSFEDSLLELQNYYQGLSPDEVVWSNELLDRRRLEAKHD